MTNSQVFLKKLMLMSIGVVLMTILVTSARADQHLIRKHQFDMTGFREVELSNAVGTMDIIPVSGSEMRIILEIESDDGGFFRRRVEIDELDLEFKERGDTLFLSFKEKKVHADWTIEMPVLDHTIIEMGVGELFVELGATELDIKMGVGDVRVEAQSSHVGRINLNVGVGDASIRGAQILDEESAFISQRIRAQGEGNHDMEIDLGVGELKIRLQ